MVVVAIHWPIGAEYSWITEKRISILGGYTKMWIRWWDCFSQLTILPCIPLLVISEVCWLIDYPHGPTMCWYSISIIIHRWKTNLFLKVGQLKKIEIGVGLKKAWVKLLCLWDGLGPDNDNPKGYQHREWREGWVVTYITEHWSYPCAFSLLGCGSWKH